MGDGRAEHDDRVRSWCDVPSAAAAAYEELKKLPLDP